VNTREKLAAIVLTFVIALSGASIGWTCAQYVKQSTINKLFMCTCGRVYLLSITGKNTQIIEITPPKDNENQGDQDHPKKKDKWI
jgi:FtsH-binding integral membrane protein